MPNVFSINKPENALPLVFDSPHSGHVYPADFNHACTAQDLEATEDKYVDDLFSEAPKHSAALLLAHFPRSYIDPNRAVCDIDPNLLAKPWEGDTNATSRSDAGIGLIRRLVKPGVPVYDRKLTQTEIQRRIDTYYTPYHDALEQLITDAHYNFGQVWHINCHSMPTTTAHPRQPIGLIGRKSKPVDFCLGDRDGTTCGKDFTHALRDKIKKMGYSVSINDPFKGVELVTKHSDPARGRHSLQLEINKSLYMNEASAEKSKNYESLKADIESLIAFCADYVDAQLTDLAAD